MSELGIYRRVAQAFDLASITNIVGAPFFAFFAKGGSREFRRQVGLITRRSTTKSNSTRSIATHPGEKRKDGPPSRHLYSNH
jgi:hypothetical protein